MPSNHLYDLFKKELKSERESRRKKRRGRVSSKSNCIPTDEPPKRKPTKKIRPRASGFHCTNAFFFDDLSQKHQMGTCWCRCSLVSCTNNYLDGDLWTSHSSSLLESKTTRSSSLKGKKRNNENIQQKENERAEEEWFLNVVSRHCHL